MIQKQETTDKIVKISISGVITILATIAAFFILFPPSQYRAGSVLGYFFIILTEVLFFLGLIIIEKIVETTEQLMIRGGVGSVLCLGAVLSIIISLIWIYSRFSSARSFVSIQIVLMLIAMLLSVLIYFSSVSVWKSNTKLMQEVNTVQDMKCELESIKKKYCEYEAPFVKYADELQCAIEELKYSDTSKVVQEDTVLMDKIIMLKLELEIEPAVEERIKEILAEINRSIKIRKLQLEKQNRGKI